MLSLVFYIVSCFFFLMIRRPPRSTRTDTLFPTRRSSDLRRAARRRPHPARPRRPAAAERLTAMLQRIASKTRTTCPYCGVGCGLVVRRAAGDGAVRVAGDPDRSEEHTSELQSLMRNSYAVFCLKKHNNI